MEILERYRQIIGEAQYPFVLEFGSCDGYHSDLLVSALEQQQKPFIFHAFEPNKELHPQILDNLKKHFLHNAGLIALFPVAVGLFNEETTFYKSGGVKIVNGEVKDHYYGSSSILPPKLVKESYPSMTFTEEKVFVRSLDRHIQLCKLEGFPIDFIWSDIQGAEKQLIQGGAETFKNVRYFYTEYDNGENYAGQAIGVSSILELLPGWEIVEDYGGDVLLKNTNL